MCLESCTLCLCIFEGQAPQHFPAPCPGSPRLPFPLIHPLNTRVSFFSASHTFSSPKTIRVHHLSDNILTGRDGCELSQAHFLALRSRLAFGCASACGGGDANIAAREGEEQKWQGPLPSCLLQGNCSPDLLVLPSASHTVNQSS